MVDSGSGRLRRHVFGGPATGFGLNRIGERGPRDCIRDVVDRFYLTAALVGHAAAAIIALVVAGTVLQVSEGTLNPFSSQQSPDGWDSDGPYRAPEKLLAVLNDLGVSSELVADVEFRIATRSFLRAGSDSDGSYWAASRQITLPPRSLGRPSTVAHELGHHILLNRASREEREALEAILTDRYFPRIRELFDPHRTLSGDEVKYRSAFAIPGASPGEATCTIEELEAEIIGCALAPPVAIVQCPQRAPRRGYADFRALFGPWLQPYVRSGDPLTPADVRVHVVSGVRCFPTVLAGNARRAASTLVCQLRDLPRPAVASRRDSLRADLMPYAGKEGPPWDVECPGLDRHRASRRRKLTPPGDTKPEPDAVPRLEVARRSATMIVLHPYL